MRGHLPLLTLAGSACLLAALPTSAQNPQRSIAPAELKSGKEFVSDETRAQQEDLIVNPGMLWVDQGQVLWHRPAGAESKSCASCHSESPSMKGVAARYPVYDTKLQRLVNLEQRIQNCRTVNQKAAPLAYESEELLALAALVAHQSLGVPISVDVDGPARPFFEAGRALYYERRGQLNLACAQCHDQNWGKRLRAERVSQGHANGFPTYRLEWQALGSLHRRLRACFQGVRAEPYVSGSSELVALELYLAWRAEGLPIETPAVRR